MRVSGKIIVKLNRAGMAQVGRSQRTEDDLKEVAEQAKAGMPSNYEVQPWKARKRAVVNLRDTKPGGLNREAKHGRLHRAAGKAYTARANGSS